LRNTPGELWRSLKAAGTDRLSAEEIAVEVRAVRRAR
jgi:hypothetical protein